MAKILLCLKTLIVKNHTSVAGLDQNLLFFWSTPYHLRFLLFFSFFLHSPSFCLFLHFLSYPPLYFILSLIITFSVFLPTLFLFQFHFFLFFRCNYVTGYSKTRPDTRHKMRLALRTFHLRK